MKGKFAKILTVILILSALSCVFAACVNEKKQYDVVFVDANNIVIKSDKVEEGRSAAAPIKAPTMASDDRYDYVFKGWDQDFSNIKSNLTIKPVFEPILRKFKVRFFDGARLVEESEYEYGSQIQKPEMTREGHIFIGWYEADSVVKYDFTQPVHNAVSLYAIWTAVGSNGLVYSMTGDFVIDYIGENPSVVIPRYNEGIEITRIAEGAFIGSAVKNVSVPLSVVDIMPSAFKGCALESITFETGSKLERIHRDAFRNTALREVELPDSLKTIGRTSFAEINTLMSVRFGAGLEVIESRAFYGDALLTSVNIPVNMVRIEKEAFVESGVNQVTFDSGCKLQTIEEYAFGNRLDGSYITDIVLPQGITRVDAYALDAVTGNIGVENDGDNFKTEENLLLTKDGTKLVFAPRDIDRNEIVIPTGVKEIGDYAFANCKSIESVDLNETAIVGIRSFVGCGALARVNFTASVAEIREEAFMNTALIAADLSLTEISRIGSRSFANTQIETLALSPHTYRIGDGAFSYTAALKNVTLSDALAYMEHNVFAYSGITSLTLPDRLETIGDSSFKGCAYLTEIVISASSGLLYIGEEAFADSSLSNINIDNALHLGHIGARSFSGTALSRISVPFSVREISSGAFTGIENITLIGYAQTDELPATWAADWRDADNVNVVYTKGTTEGDYEYVVIGVKAHLTAYNGSETDIVVPNEIGGYKINGFGAIYSGNTALKSVVLPSGIKHIDAYAFADCTQLTDVDFGEACVIENIGDRAFAGCVSLASVTIPATVRQIDIGAFKGAERLTDVNFAGNEALKYIGENCFEDCVNLRSISLPNSLYTIGRYAFRNCTSLTKALGISDKSKLVNIEEGAFYGSGLDKVTIPDSVEYIGDEAFAECGSLTYVRLDPNLVYIGAGAFYADAYLGEIIIPLSVKYVGADAFGGCERITIYAETNDASFDEGWNPDGHPVYFGYEGKGADADFDYVFANGLAMITAYNGTGKEVTIPEYANGRRVYALTKNSFTDTVAEKVTLSAQLHSIDDYAFSGAKNLKEIVFDRNSVLYSIGESAFADCNRLESAAIPASVKKMGANAFSGTNTDVYIVTDSKPIPWDDNWHFGCGGETIWEYERTGTATGFSYIVTKRGVYISKGDRYATEVVIPEKIDGIDVVAINDSAFRNGMSLLSVYIPASVRRIGENAFSYCNTLNSVVIGEDSMLTEIGDRAFSGCSSINEIVIPSRVTTIGDYAFSNCKMLYSLLFEYGSELRSIGTGAFRGCTLRNEVIIPVTVNTIGDRAFFDAATASAQFRCEIGARPIGWAEMWTERDNDIVWGCSNSGDNVDFSYVVKEGGVYLTEYRSLATEVVVPEEINGIKVVYIGEIFRNKDITSLTVEAAITEIDDHAFYNCNALKRIDHKYPELIERIGNYAFGNCEKLTEFKIGKNVSELGVGVFSGCIALTDITIESDDFVSKNEIIYSRDMTRLISYPGKKDAVKFTVPRTVKTIESNAFNNQNLETIEIGESVTHIADDAFASCSPKHIYVANGNTVYSAHDDGVLYDKAGKRLLYYPSGRTAAAYELPANTESIAARAFYGSKIGELTINSSLKNVETGAFVGMDRLSTFILDAESEYFSVTEGSLYYKDGNTLVSYPSARNVSKVTIKCSYILSYAFWGVKNAETITLEGVSSIQDHGFVDCNVNTSILLRDCIGISSWGDLWNYDPLPYTEETTAEEEV